MTHPKQIEKLPLLKPYTYIEKNWDLGHNPTKEQLEEFFKPGEMAMIDYEKMAANGVDAIELEYSALFRDALSTWDCNGILVMNPDVVVPA